MTINTQTLVGGESVKHPSPISGQKGPLISPIQTFIEDPSAQYAFLDFLSTFLVLRVRSGIGKRLSSHTFSYNLTTVIGGASLVERCKP